MMRIAARLGLFAALGVAVCGCAESPPVHYHSLAAAAPAGGSGGARLLVEILPPVVPERLNRAEMVLTAADGRLDVRDLDHWAAPLADEVRQVLADALWSQLEAADVYQAPVAATSTSLPQYRLAFRVERFDAVPGKAVRADAAWTLRRLPLGTSITCRLRVDLPLADRTPEAAAAALGRATGGLAKAVADSLGRLDRGMVDACAAGGA